MIGVLSGTPTQIGNYQLVFTVTDSASPTPSVYTVSQLNVTVTPASDATTNTAGPVPTKPKFWRLGRNNPRPGWKTGEWPTPVPTRAQLEGYTATVDLIR